jgi:hypothetical protein
VSSPEQRIRSRANVNRSVQEAFEQLSPDAKGRAQREARQAIDRLKASRDILAEKLEARAQARCEATRRKRHEAAKQADEQLEAAKQFRDQFKDVHAPGFDELRDDTVRAAEEWAKNVRASDWPLDDAADRIDSLFLTWSDTLACGAIDLTRERRARKRIEATLRYGVDTGLMVGGAIGSIAHPAAVLAAVVGAQRLLSELRDSPRNEADPDEARHIGATEVINAVDGVIKASTKAV